MQERRARGSGVPLAGRRTPSPRPPRGRAADASSCRGCNVFPCSERCRHDVDPLHLRSGSAPPRRTARGVDVKICPSCFSGTMRPYSPTLQSAARRHSLRPARTKAAAGQRGRALRYSPRSTGTFCAARCQFRGERYLRRRPRRRVAGRVRRDRAALRFPPQQARERATLFPRFRLGGPPAIPDRAEVHAELGQGRGFKCVRHRVWFRGGRRPVNVEGRRSLARRGLGFRTARLPSAIPADAGRPAQSASEISCGWSARPNDRPCRRDRRRSPTSGTRPAPGTFASCRRAEPPCFLVLKLEQPEEVATPGSAAQKASERFPFHRAGNHLYESPLG